MKKVVIFKNHEEYFANPSGSQYMTGTWASDDLEKFINRSDIEVLSIHYAGGRDDATMVIYKETYVCGECAHFDCSKCGKEIK